MFCARCKEELPDGAIYCLYCGKKQVVEHAGGKAKKRANGTGTVYKLAGRRRKPWIAAKKKSVIGYYETKKEALEALSAFERSEVPNWYNITLNEVYEKWKAESWDSLSQKSKEMYESVWKKLEKLKEKKMRDIRASDYQAAIDALEGKSRSLKNQVRVLCSQLCKWAQNNDIIQRNYAESLNVGKAITKEKEIFTKEEINLIKSACNRDTAAIIVMILIYSGMRINELLDMKKKDVHLDGSTPYMVGGKKTDAGRNRMIPIALPILPYIQKLMQKPGEYLITNSAGGKKDYRNFRMREYYPLLESLKIKKRTLHTTRHTFASMMVEAGARPEDLQKILGHADYSITANIYNHANVDQLTRSIRLLNGQKVKSRMKRSKKEAK